jgi:hypothetical protein
MTSSLNEKLMKWQFDESASFKNIKMIKWKFDKTAS